MFTIDAIYYDIYNCTIVYSNMTKYRCMPTLLYILVLYTRDNYMELVIHFIYNAKSLNHIYVSIILSVLQYGPT